MACWLELSRGFKLFISILLKKKSICCSLKLGIHEYLLNNNIGLLNKLLKNNFIHTYSKKFLIIIIKIIYIFLY